MAITDHSMTSIKIERKKLVINSDVNNQKCGHSLLKFIIDQGKLKELINHTNWAPILAEDITSKACSMFIDEIQRCINLSRYSVKTDANLPLKLKPWMTQELVKKAKRKEFLFNKTKCHPNNDGLRKHFLKFRNKLQRETRMALNQYYVNKFQVFKSNIREKWNLFKELTGDEKAVKQDLELIIDGEIVKDPSTLADEFNKYFMSVFDSAQSFHDTRCNLHLKSPSPCANVLNSFFIEPVTAYEIIMVVNALPLRKTPGIDGMDCRSLKKCHYNYSTCICSYL
jgi:hypothetical protein